MKTPQRPNGTAAIKTCAVCLTLLMLSAVGAARAQGRKHARPRPRAAGAAVKAPVSLNELLKSLGDGGPKTKGLVREVEARGVDFEMTADAETTLRDAGASAALVEAARKNYRPARQAAAHATLPMPVVIQADPLLFKDEPVQVPYTGHTPTYSGGMGPGTGGGMGTGTGGGVGVGDGTGYGPGYGTGRGYNTGGGDGSGDGGGSGGEVDYTRTFKPAEVTRKAVITAKPEPGFTEEARKNNVSGTVRLRAVLSASGSVQRISVVKSLPDGLTEKAIAAAKQIRFTPAQKDGHTVSQYVTLEYNFYIESYYNEDEVTKRAVILEKPAPEYTEEARRNKVSGKVVLKVVLLSYGGVSVMSVEQSMPYGLTDKAIEAARQIKFTPAEKDGRAVTQLATIEYNFAP